MHSLYWICKGRNMWGYILHMWGYILQCCCMHVDNPQQPKAVNNAKSAHVSYSAISTRDSHIIDRSTQCAHARGTASMKSSCKIFWPHGPLSAVHNCQRTMRCVSLCVYCVHRLCKVHIPCRLSVSKSSAAPLCPWWFRVGRRWHVQRVHGPC